MLSMVGRILEAPVAAILALPVSASVRHVDETSFRLNGRTIWVWIFLDPATEAVLYVLRLSKGRGVLREVLPGFRGVIVYNGRKPYRAWYVQRCWAHILRETRYLVQSRPRSRVARGMLERRVRAYGSACVSAGTRMPRARRARASLLGHLTRIVADNRAAPSRGGSWASWGGPPPACWSSLRIRASRPPTTPPSAACTRQSSAARSAAP